MSRRLARRKQPVFWGLYTA